MNGAQRQMTWEELCDEMVKQRTRAETAEAEVERLMILATKYSDERITAEAKAAQERERAEDLERLFALQQTRMNAATALWREATGKHDVMPDLGELLGWLQTRIEALEGCVRELAKWLRAYAPGLCAGLLDRVDILLTPISDAELDAARQIALLAPATLYLREQGAESPEAGGEGV